MADDKGKETNVGTLRFGLRYRENGVPRTYWFKFDESDIDRSREILRDSQELVFDVQIESPPKNIDLYVHLGRDISDCSSEDELSIQLTRKDPDRWRPETGYTSERRLTDVERIKRFHWRAAYARATLCKGPGDPVLFKNTEPVQVKLALGYADTWYEDMYNDILERLSKTRPDARLTSSFGLYLEAMKRARERAEGSTSLELYYRLQRILEEYEGTLGYILKNPYAEISPKVSYYNVPPEEAPQYHHQRSRQMSVHETYRASKRGGKFIPTSFVGSEPERSTDNEANRFASASVQRVRELMRKVRQSLKDYINSEKAANRRFLAQEKKNTSKSPIYRSRETSISRHSEKASRLAKSEKRFLRYSKMLPNTQGAGHVLGESATLYYDPRYAKLRYLTNLLDFTLRSVDTNRDAVPFEVDAFHALYERWCFIQVVEALKAIGFEFVSEGEPETTPFYHHPVPHQCNARMRNERAPEFQLEVWYERRYPKYDPQESRLYGLETRYTEGKTSYQKVRPDNWRPKVTPDIALEFKEVTSSTLVPEIVTLDPTLGSVHADKYEYREAIRCFNTREPNSRESRRIVRASWGIHPERGSEDVSSYMKLDQDNDFSKGFIVLRPTEESVNALAQSLDRILSKVGLLSPVE